MKTDLEVQSGQRKPVLLVSGVVALCLFVLALLERRRSTPVRSQDPRRPHSFGDVAADGQQVPGRDQRETAAPSAGDVRSGAEHKAEVEVEVEPAPDPNRESQVEVDSLPERLPASDVGFAVPFQSTVPRAAGLRGVTAETPAGEEPGTPGDDWFARPAPSSPWPSAPQSSFAAEPGAQAAAFEQAAVAEHDEPVIELPTPAASARGEIDPKRLPPPRLRRFMGTGATVLALGLVLCAGVLASGATADSTSDPATVPDAVATTAPLPGVLPDSTLADTTATDTTVTDTTSTDTTSTDTTTTGTATTSTTATDTTATGTTPTDTTATTTMPTDPVVTTPTSPQPPVTAPVAPPASDPVAALPVVPDVGRPAVVPTTPVVLAPPTPLKKKKRNVAKKVVVEAPAAPAPPKAAKVATPNVGTPAASNGPVVRSATASDAIGSILSAHSVIPAVDASLLPTPAQVSFYVKAAKPLAKLPPLAKIDHALAQRLVAAGRRGKVGWTVLAAIARLDGRLGARSGPLVGRDLPAAPSGDGLAALATYLTEHGATRNPLAPTTARKALTRYFHGSTRKADRAIALAALYGALGPAGMQHGVRAETARLQKRVLADHRVHLTVAGRSDIRHGRVDPRVLVALEYLANSFDKVGISDLVSGGALFSRSGSVSAHLYGRAADVASLHGKVVRGHQGPGTMTEQAIKKLLLLPKSLRPRQVISLMDVDGPTGNHGSFALPDHYDRIQIDY